MHFSLHLNLITKNIPAAGKAYTRPYGPPQSLSDHNGHILRKLFTAFPDRCYAVPAPASFQPNAINPEIFFPCLRLIPNVTFLYRVQFYLDKSPGINL